PKLDQITIKHEGRSVPHVTIDAVSEKRYLIDVRGIATSAAYGPIKIDESVLLEMRMQGDAQQATLGSVIDRQIERRARQCAVEDTLDFAGRLFENKKIVGTNERHAGRLIESSDNGIDSQIVVEHDRRR